MQGKLWKLIQYVYLVIAVIFLLEGIFKFREDTTQAVILFVFSILLVVLFFFKRKFRLRVEATNKHNQRRK